MRIHNFCKMHLNKAPLPVKDLIRMQCIKHLDKCCEACPFNWDHHKSQPSAARMIIKLFKLETK